MHFLFLFIMPISRNRVGTHFLNVLTYSISCTVHGKVFHRINTIEFEVLMRFSNRKLTCFSHIEHCYYSSFCYIQDQPSIGVLRKRCSEDVQQICRRKSMSKFGLNKVALQLY